jgi:arsenite/tail-anchored protein-transporting ATPase
MRFSIATVVAISTMTLPSATAFQTFHPRHSMTPLTRVVTPETTRPFPTFTTTSITGNTAPHAIVASQRPHTQLYSLNKLIDEISQTRKPGSAPNTVFVGGKGGVGKTTVSSALAVQLASDMQKDLNVLIVSTDPAHSLGDALDEDLRKGHGKPILMTDPLTGGRLHACEVDAAEALEEFRSNLAAFDIDRLAEALGVPADLLEGFGLREFSGLLNNPPPGLDELVALSNVLDSKSITGQYDVVVVDTAPTGHTLRLLALPQFLDGFLGKLIKLRMKLTGITSTLQAFFGNEQAAQRAKTIDNAVNRLERLRDRLQDDKKTRFVVVTVPTKLGVAESKRLVKELQSQKVSVTDVVVNQCVGMDDTEGEALKLYYDRRKAGQSKWVDNLRHAVSEVSASDEFKRNGSDKPIAITSVPFYDVELVGVPALAYMGSQTFKENPGFSHLLENDQAREPKVVICGGKGGVGKTTTSSALAVSMAAQGLKVAIISTDPAHSLGDALDVPLAGGNMIDIPLIGVPPSDGSLSALEVDPSSALKQFKGIVDKLVGSDSASTEDKGDIRNTFRELQEVFDTLPAGTDEVVALAKIVNLVKKGGYDRIVLDTAPTGHTLRMLSTPGFLAELIDRLLKISDKVNSNAMVRMLVSSSARAQEMETAADTAKSTLLSFQLQMYDLEDMFSNAEQTEFLIVTVPTELAVRESMRLLNDLTFEAPDMPIKVRNIVVNQVLKGDDSDVRTFLDHVAHTQKVSMEDLEKTTSTYTKPPVITKVNYLDTEPRGVFGLKTIAGELLREE